jgi:hypothetical protein
VPTAYGHREVLIRGYVDSVVISSGADIIARHPRSYELEDFVRPAALPGVAQAQDRCARPGGPAVRLEPARSVHDAAPPAGARKGKQGKREFVQVLRLLEVFEIDDVAAGVCAAIDRGAIGFDAVKQLVLCRIERRPARLNMTVYPYLPRAPTWRSQHSAMRSPAW